MSSWWAAGVGVAQTGLSIAGGRSARRRARRQAEVKSKISRETTDEKIRRRTLAQRFELGTARTFAGASGTQLVEGSGYSAVLDEMQAEFSRELRWMRRAGQLEQEAIAAELDSALSSIKYETYSGVLSGTYNVGRTQGWWL